MGLFTIKNLGKTFFWIFFILGNICLFGYFFTKNDEFAVAGYFLLIFGTMINGLVFLGLIIFGIFSKKHFDEAINSAMIMLINIPFAILYAWIGTNFR